MPKTKKVRSKATKTSKQNKPDTASKSEKQERKSELKNGRKDFATESNRKILCLQDERDEAKSQIALLCQDAKFKLMSVSHRTLEQVENGVGCSQSLITIDASTLSDILSCSTISKPPCSTRVTRRTSKSVGDDEVASRASSETRQPRTAKKLTSYKKTARRSRSAASSEQQRTTRIIKGQVTPQNRQISPPQTFGLITPKVKPNAPQAILRRPQLGEVAFSMQGSPLMTSDVMSTNPNVNIPLSNGQFVTIQPHPGLRRSQVPYMDEEIRKQVKVLYDNLSKVIHISK